MDVSAPWQRVIWTAEAFVAGFCGGRPSQNSKGGRGGAGQEWSGGTEDRLNLSMTNGSRTASAPGGRTKGGWASIGN